MKFKYTPKGVCSVEILVDIDDADKSTIRDIQFVGGCSGNTQGVAALAKGRKIDEVIGSLSGIRCGRRPTSCPDQLATALTAIKEQIA
ncbi:MAG: TIGR03905 family TSCPD domain-containing protein [Clostridia bacterium]|nr:TIGR03905 family TSCPD domain-containing protein [Clostridia bacterium]